MAKYAETLVKLPHLIKRDEHKGYFIYLMGEEKGDGVITRICRSPIMRKKKSNMLGVALNEKVL